MAYDQVFEQYQRDLKSGLDAIGQPTPTTPTLTLQPPSPALPPQTQKAVTDTAAGLASIETPATPGPTLPADAWKRRTDETAAAYMDRQDAYQVGDFKAGLKSGWEQLKGLGALSLGALGQKTSELTDGKVGNDLQTWGYDAYKDTEKAAAPYQEGRATKIEDIKGPGSALDWFQYTLGNVAPSIGESLLSGAIGFGLGSAATPAGSILGGVAGAAGKGLIKKALTNYAEKQMVKGMSREAAEKAAGAAVGAGVGTFLTGYQMGVGDIYSETLDENGKGNATSALLYALPYAGVEALTDLWLGGKLLTGAKGADLVKRVPAAMVTGGLLEGGQELTQEAINLAAGMQEGKQYTPQEVLSRLGNSLAAGFLPGAVLGGAGGIRRDPNEGKTEVDMLLDRAQQPGPLPGWQDPAALQQAVTNPQTDDVIRAQALAAVGARLASQDAILARRWNEASVDAIARKQPISQVLADLQARTANAQTATSTAPTSSPLPNVSTSSTGPTGRVDVSAPLPTTTREQLSPPAESTAGGAVLPSTAPPGGAEVGTPGRFDTGADLSARAAQATAEAQAARKQEAAPTDTPTTNPTDSPTTIDARAPIITDEERTDGQTTNAPQEPGTPPQPLQQGQGTGAQRQEGLLDATAPPSPDGGAFSPGTVTGQSDDRGIAALDARGPGSGATGAARSVPAVDDARAGESAPGVIGNAYEGRYRDRISRINDATDQKEITRILTEEEYQDGERHIAGTGAVERAAKSRAKTLNEKEVFARREAAGEWLDVPSAKRGTRQEAQNWLDSAQQSNEYDYRVSGAPSSGGMGMGEYTVERRKKIEDSYAAPIQPTGNSRTETPAAAAPEADAGTLGAAAQPTRAPDVPDLTDGILTASQQSDILAKLRDFPESDRQGYVTGALKVSGVKATRGQRIAARDRLLDAAKSQSEVRAATQPPSAVDGATVPATGSAVVAEDAGAQAGVVAQAGRGEVAVNQPPTNQTLIANSHPEVAQPTPIKSLKVLTNTLSGQKQVKVKEYALPGYRGPALGVESYKLRGADGYRVYIIENGMLIEDSNAVTDVNTTLKNAVQRVSSAINRGVLSVQAANQQPINAATRASEPTSQHTDDAWAGTDTPRTGQTVTYKGAPRRVLSVTQKDGQALVKHAPTASKGRAITTSLELLRGMQETIADQNAAPTEYRYAAINRPIGYGTAPAGYLRVDPRPTEGADHYDQARHGIAVYDRPLTADESRQYELVPIVEGRARDQLVEDTAQQLAEYADNYRKAEAEMSDKEFTDALKGSVFSAVKGKSSYAPSVGDWDAFTKSVWAKMQGHDAAQTQKETITAQETANGLQDSTGPGVQIPDNIKRGMDAILEPAKQVANALDHARKNLDANPKIGLGGGRYAAEVWADNKDKIADVHQRIGETLNSIEDLANREAARKYFNDHLPDFTLSQAEQDHFGDQRAAPLLRPVWMTPVTPVATDGVAATVEQPTTATGTVPIAPVKRVKNSDKVLPGDTLDVAVAKLGGLRLSEMQRTALSDHRRAPRGLPGTKRLVHNGKTALSLASMEEKLRELGYPITDENDLATKLDAAVRGQRIISHDGADVEGERLAQKYEDTLTAQDDDWSALDQMDFDDQVSFDEERATQIRLAGIHAIGEDAYDVIAEKIATQHEQSDTKTYLDALEQAISDEQASRTQSASQETHGLRQEEPGGFTLTGESQADLDAKRQADEQRARDEAQRLKAEEDKRAADARVDDFSLSALEGDRSKQELSDRGQQGMDFEAIQPETIIDSILPPEINETLDKDALFDALLDEEFASSEATPKILKTRKPSSAPRTPKTPRTVSESATSAIKNTAAAFKEGGKGLLDLFDPGKGKLNSGLTFDEETYAKAKPHFMAMAAHLKDAAIDVADLMRAIIRAMRDQFGMSREGVANMKPYIIRFAEDIESGVINLEGTDVQSTATDPAADRGEAGTQESADSGSAEPAGPGASAITGQDGSEVTGAGENGNGDRGVSGTRAPAVGKRRRARVSSANGELTDPAGAPGPGNAPGSDGRGASGLSTQSTRTTPTSDAARESTTRPDLEAAGKVKIQPANAENIKASLPQLLEGQQADVLFAEKRFESGGRGVLFTNGTGTGKAQPLDAKILTPSGWKRMGDMRVGDEVIAGDGSITVVTGVFPQGEKPIYRVEFSDGASTECCDEHLWLTQTLYARRKARANADWNCAQPKVRHLSEIRASLDDQHFIPVVGEVATNGEPLPIPAYTLGVILGDGCLRGGSIIFSSQDAELVEHVSADLPQGFRVVPITVQESRCQSWRISADAERQENGRFSSHPMVDALRDMGLFGADSFSKFIPESYLFAARDDRLAMLRGLMDTDGTVDHRTGSVSFSSVSPQLRDGVIALVRSLGGIATYTQKTPIYTYKDEKRVGQVAYTVCIHIGNSISLFALSRKQNLTTPKLHAPRRKIVGVVEVGTKQAQCISVSHPSHLYVTDDYIVTHNTFSGLGIIARQVRQGKGNILITVPSENVAASWIKAARQHFGLDIYQLTDTQDAGPDGSVVITTYANFGQNQNLVNRQWDMLVHDEAHYLSSSQDGDATAALKMSRALSGHPRGAFEYAHIKERALTDEIAILRNTAKDDKANAKKAELDARVREHVAERARHWEAKNTRRMDLSATPFSYHASIDSAEGFLFDYGDDPRQSRGGYNTPDAQQAFMIEHFGYRMRTGKLNKPTESVDQALMEREFNRWLNQQGALSGRMLEVDHDYSREFVAVDSLIGNKIDDGMKFILDRSMDKEDPMQEGYRQLQDKISESFDYHERIRLLEAIKAPFAVERAKRHVAMGRKVVIFHSRIKGGSRHPFRFEPIGAASGQELGDLTKAYNIAVADFKASRPDLYNLDLGNLTAPLDLFKRKFGDRVTFYNGTIKKAEKVSNPTDFVKDDGPYDVIVVQDDAGKEGISLHDTTGKHQRALINIGLPIKPTQAIQIEGRTYRVGQQSDAIFEYFNTGTNFERWTFAQKIAERASTAENLAMGDSARKLRDSFVDAFENPSDGDPDATQGKGGKERDRAAYEALTPFQEAKTHYFANQQTRGRRDQRAGADYYATPEPLGQKMVEWAELRPNESALEPSAGHGAIARYFPENVRAMFVEPSSELLSRLALRARGTLRQQRFEDLDEGANKFDAIVMNPPYGAAGATARDHLAKAMNHLKNGGRIVALLPDGPAANKKIEDLLYGKDGESVSSLKDQLKRATGERAGELRKRINQLQNFHLRAEIALPSVTFDRAGTSVKTRVLIIDRVDASYDGNISKRSRNEINVETVSELFDRIENMGVPDRIEGIVSPEEVLTNHGMRVAELPEGGIINHATKEEWTYGLYGKTYDNRQVIGQLAGKHGGTFDRGEKVWMFRTDPTEDLAKLLQGNPVEGLIQASSATTDNPDLIEHTTQKGKVLKGVVRMDLTKDQAKAIDPFTFSKNGGYFIRHEHLGKLAELDGASRFSLGERMPKTGVNKIERYTATKRGLPIPEESGLIGRKLELYRLVLRKVERPNHDVDSAIGEMSDDDISTYIAEFLAQPDITIPRTKPEKRNIANPPAPEDAPYMRAVADGDMQTAQRLVDEAARDAGFVVEGYHWSGSDFNVFKGNEGFHFGTEQAAEDIPKTKGYATSIDYAIEQDGDEFVVVPDNGPMEGEDIGRFQTKAQAQAFVKSQPKRIKPQRFLLKIENPYRAEDQGAGRGWSALIGRVKKMRKGYDGIVYTNEVEDVGSDSYVVWDAKRIKSADAVVRDDAGNVIPLSQRFKTNPDIRFDFGETASTRPTEHLSVAYLQAKLDPIVRALKGLNIPVRVVANERALNDTERAKLREARKANPNLYPKAIYRGNEIILIASNVSSVKDALVQLNHEKAHYALRQVFGPTYESFLDELIADRNADVQVYADTRGLDMTTLEGRREAADEMLAHMAERNDPADLPFLTRVYQAIRAALRAMGFRIRMSDSDLREILAASKRYVERGDVKGALRTRGRFGGNATGRNQDARFMFAGRHAQTADTMALSTAQARIEAGEDAETVRQETGWHKGADGKDAASAPRPANAEPKLTRGLTSIVRDAKIAESWRDWYDRHVDVLTEEFEEDADLFRDLLAITSQGVTVASNVQLALRAYEQLKLGLPFDGVGLGKANLEKYRDGIDIGGLKIGAFAQAMAGVQEAVVIDRHMARYLFNVDVPTPRQYRRGEKVIREAARKLGWNPREVQAAIWAFQIFKGGKAPNDYKQAIRNKRDSFRAVRGRLAGGVSASQAGAATGAPEGRPTDAGGTEDITQGTEDGGITNHDIRFSLSVPDFVANASPEIQSGARKLSISKRTQTLKERFDEIRTDIGKKIIQGAFDSLAPVKDISLKGYQLGTLAKNTEGTMEAAMLHGVPVMDADGALNILRDPEMGLLNIFSALGTPDEIYRFLGWRAANRADEINRKSERATLRAQALKAEIAQLRSARVAAIRASNLRDVRALETDIRDKLAERQHWLTRAAVKERNLTKDEIAAWMAFNQGTLTDGADRQAMYTAVNDKFSRFLSAVLDVGETAGIIDAASRPLWESYHYVPFNRDREENDRIFTAGNGLTNQIAFHQMKGGIEHTRDLLVNTLDNLSHLLSASAKNRAAQEIVKDAEPLGYVRRWTRGQMLQNSQGKLIKPENAITIRENGKPVIYDQVAPDLLLALQSMSPVGLQGAPGKLLIDAKRLLTRGVTANPAFKLWRNMIRDAVHSIAVSGLGYNPFGNSWEGIQALKNPEQYAHMLAGNGLMRFGAAWEGTGGMKRIMRLIEDMEQDQSTLNTQEKIGNFVKHWWDKYQELGDSVENMQRAALYQRVFDETGSHLEASFQSRDLIDFNRTGAWPMVRTLIQMVPFMNARLQGLYKLGVGYQEDPRRFLMTTGTIALAGVGLMLMYKDDEDWKKREDWDRDTYWWFKIGDKAFRLPKPFEIGAMASAVERGIEYAVSDEMTGKRLTHILLGLIADNLSMNPVPQLFKPITDVYSNTDSFTGRPIETMGMEKLQKRDRFTEMTPELARLLGQAGNVTQLSPEQLDHLARGYLGWFWTIIGAGTDAVLRPLEGRASRPSLMTRTIAQGIMEDLGSDPVRSRYVSQFYDQSLRIQQAYQSMRDAIKRGDTERAGELNAKYGGNLRQQALKINRDRLKIAELNQGRKRIMSDQSIDASAKAKALYRLNDQMDQISRAVGPPVW